MVHEKEGRHINKKRNKNDRISPVAERRGIEMVIEQNTHLSQ